MLTRALAEMSRFAVELGANPLTFLGLSGVGDLIATGIAKFSLLAIPFFILAGNLMNIAGVTGRIYAFAVALVGFGMNGKEYNGTFDSTLSFSGICLIFALPFLQLLLHHHE